jgi:hypothetical protein
MMGIVVDDGDAAAAQADLEAPPDATEVGQAGRRTGHVETQLAEQGERPGGVARRWLREGAAGCFHVLCCRHKLHRVLIGP